MDVQAIMRKPKIQFCDFCTYGQKFKHCLTFSFSLQTSLDNVPWLYLTVAISIDSVNSCCHRELHFRCPALNVNNNCELQTLPCLSVLIFMKLKPSNSSKPLTEIGQRAKISRQRRNRQTHPSDLLP